MKSLKKSIGLMNWRLFIALLFMGACPAVYTTIRTFFLGQLPGEWAYSIAGQLSWVNLIYEVINEAIILPLFFFMGDSVNNRKEFTNRIKTGILFSLVIYFVLSALIFLFAEPMLNYMAASSDILAESVIYIRIETVANIFGIVYSFICVALITIGVEKYVYILTVCKLLLSVFFDTFFISKLPISLDLGVNGIGYSNIIVNILLIILAVLLITHQGYSIFDRTKLSFSWIKGFLKIGGISGLESFVRNFAYITMVSRMVNMVGEQGTYWVANNFIWGWMLLPITQLGELIKQEVAKDKKAICDNTPGYFAVTGIVVVLWIILIPFYKPFMKYILNYSDVDKLFELVMILFAFYVLYAIQNVFDATFYGRGKTNYMLFESVVTNTVFYGTYFIMYLTGVWTPSLIGIALMFGIGNAFDTVVSGIAYWYYRKHLK